jgi:ribosomal-protein-alanine N-acetyltransferase
MARRTAELEAARAMHQPEDTKPLAIGRLDDAVQLAHLHGLAFTDGAWSRAAFAAMLAQKTVTAFGHDDGFIVLQDMPEGVEILTLAVHPDKRRRGIARRLIAHIRAALGPKLIWLEVAADNDAACALYAGLGFVVNGRRRNYYKRAGNFPVDALLMKLEVEEGQNEQKNGT